MDDVYVNSKKAREITGVTNKTLRVWDSQNKIRVIRMLSGQRRYHKQDLENTRNHDNFVQEKRKICYARVSSTKQMEDLTRQKDFFKDRFPDYDVVSDVGSGINWKRKGLQTILDGCLSKSISEVVVAHRDRLCRFAFELFESIFKKCKVKLVVLNEPDEKSEDSELSDDILSIVHVYSCRKMGKRRYTKKNSNKDKKDEDNLV